MLKLTKIHTIYEVYNEWAAESVYVDHKPTKEELEFLVKKEWGTKFRYGNVVIPLEEFIKKFILVEKERHLYTAAVKAKKKTSSKMSFEPSQPCNNCGGTGKKSDDAYSVFDCPFCGGSGLQ